MRTTLEEERAEVWSGILDGMSEDPDQAEACRYLARHLIEDGSRKGPRRIPETGVPLRSLPCASPYFLTVYFSNSST